MTGFVVDDEDLRRYADKLSNQRERATAIGGLVDTVDVGDQSWGVVGLFVKNEYSEMLADLKVLFGQLDQGLQSGAEKFKQAAEGYRRNEEGIRDLLNGIALQFDEQKAV